MTIGVLRAPLSIQPPRWFLFGCLLLALILVLPPVAAASSPDADRFNHPSGVFSLSIPKGWGAGTRFPGNPNVVSFHPPGGAEFTISITQNISLPPELPQELASSMFPDASPITKPTREKGVGWNAIRQDFEKTANGKTRVWLAAFYGYRTNAIAITLSNTKENIGQLREAFERTIKSIEFHEKR